VKLPKIKFPKIKIPFDAGDLFVFASLVFLFRGLYLIEPAYAYIGVGVILLCLGIVMVRSKAGQRGDDG
jgi:hypothetical protein